MSEENVNQEPQGGSAEGGEENTAPQYITREDFDTFRNELTGQLRSIAEPEEKGAQAKSSNDQGPAKPDPTKYNFEKDPIGAQEKYQQDWYKYLRHQEKIEEQKQNETQEPYKKLESIEKGYKKKMREYAESNPSFNEDVKKHGAVETDNTIRFAVYRQKNAPEIVHHLIKNRDEVKALKTILDTDGPEAMLDRVYEIGAELRVEKKFAEGNRQAAFSRPPRINSFGGEGAASKKSYADMYKNFHS